ncbi:MAG: hypothetical protein WCY11_20765 [Novosphingobium sp.]
MKPSLPGQTGTRRPSKLDRAIVASVIAMVAFNLFVLTQQFDPAEAFAAINAALVQRA